MCADRYTTGAQYSQYAEQESNLHPHVGSVMLRHSTTSAYKSYAAGGTRTLTESPPTSFKAAASTRFRHCHTIPCPRSESNAHWTRSERVPSTGLGYEGVCMPLARLERALSWLSTTSLCQIGVQRLGWYAPGAIRTLMRADLSRTPLPVGILRRFADRP